nr:MAG TPA: hypothetical protein [Caudoviricetes sp.]
MFIFYFIYSYHTFFHYKNYIALPNCPISR